MRVLRVPTSSGRSRRAACGPCAAVASAPRVPPWCSSACGNHGSACDSCDWVDTSASTRGSSRRWAPDRRRMSAGGFMKQRKNGNADLASPHPGVNARGAQTLPGAPAGGTAPWQHLAPPGTGSGTEPKLTVHRFRAPRMWGIPWSRSAASALADGVCGRRARRLRRPEAVQ
jgi:hypothetical protein